MSKLCSELPEGLSSWAGPQYHADMSHPAFEMPLAQSIRERLPPPAKGQEDAGLSRTMAVFSFHP